MVTARGKVAVCMVRGSVVGRLVPLWQVGETVRVQSRAQDETRRRGETNSRKVVADMVHGSVAHAFVCREQPVTLYFMVYRDGRDRKRKRRRYFSF